MFETLVSAMQEARSDSERGFTFLGSDGAENRYSFRALVDEAERRGRHLLGLGLKKGDRLAMVLPEPEEFVLSFLGAVSVGVIPVPMYPPLALGKLDSYMDSARRIIEAAGARMLLASKQVSTILWGLIGKVEGLEELVLVDRFRGAPSYAGAVEPIVASDVCFLQFTSGSTADPKGVIVTHQNLLANANAIMHDGLGASGERGDVGVSWLPLYHDMGLIGFVIAPITQRVPVVFIPTISFVKRPRIWMDTVAKYKGTITFAPNFAFALASKHGPKQLAEGIDLSSLRVVGCGAEPINPKTMETFLATFAGARLAPAAIMPAYGMAEATLAMAFDRLDRKFQTAAISRARYEVAHVAEPAGEGDERLEIVDCGRTFGGHELAIMSEHGRLLPDGHVGEIVFRGPSVSPGYWRDEARTKATFKDGWLHTGDLGFMFEGRIYISGRKKDLIIFNGKNYAPQAIEWEVEHVDAVRKGNVVAFAVRGADTERLIVVAECKGAVDPAIAEKIRSQVKSALGLVADDVLLLPAGSLPKTSSGKLQRAKTREQYERGTLGKENRTLGGNATRAVLARHLATSVFARVRHRVRRMRGAIPTPIVAVARALPRLRGRSTPERPARD